MKKVLIVMTNADHFEANQEKTGLWLAEATDFVKPMLDAGVEVDYVSPKGGLVPIDPRSLEPAFVSAQTDAMYHNEEFADRALTNSMSADQVDPAQYDAIYYTGGHGVLFDFPDNEKLQEISASIYANGGFVASVCHGVAGLLNIKDANGNNLIAGKKITGFTNMEEQLSGKQELVPFSTEDEAKSHGAEFVCDKPFATFALADQRVITGQNPMSGGAVAQKLLEEMN